MNLPTLSIQRPVLASMMSAVLILFGLISYTHIALDRFPNVAFPIISITTTMPGAEPEVIDTSVTRVIQDAVNTVPGLDNVKAYSRPNVSLVIIQFDLSKNIDVAFNEVQAKINSSVNLLPDSADQPTISKVSVGGAPIMQLTLTGDRTLQELNVYARNVIKRKLETIDGVGEITIDGERKRTIRILLQPDRMAAYGIDPRDVISAIKNEHVQIAGGTLVDGSNEQLLDLDLEYHSIDALSGLVVAVKNGLAITLADIAQVQDGLEDFRQLALFNDKTAVGLGIIKISSANTVAIINEVKQRLATRILPHLPPGLDLQIANDQAAIINKIIDALRHHITIGTLLAGLVVLFFLQNFRSTLIISLAIPISLLGAVAIMYLVGFTFNTLTLLSLLLLIGIVVDDAIVVLENVHRCMQAQPNMPRATSVKTGCQEVMFSIFGATMTLVAIFIPVIFLGGIIGRFFRSFAIVVTAGVIISYFVSLTLIPKLCAQYLHVENTHFQFCHRVLSVLERVYHRVLKHALYYPKSVLAFALGILITSVLVIGGIKKTFLPAIDDGQISIQFKTPPGTSIATTEKKLREILAIIQTFPEVSNTYSKIGSARSTVGVNQGNILVTLVPHEKRHRSQYAIQLALSKALRTLAGVAAFPTEVPIIGGTRGEPLQFILHGPDRETVNSLSRHLRKTLEQIPKFGDIDLDDDRGLPQLQLIIDTIRASQMGLSADVIGQMFTVFAGGRNVAKYSDNIGQGERYDIRLKAKPNEFVQPNDLSKIYLRTAQNDFVSMTSVAHLQPSLGPSKIFRFDLQYANIFYVAPEMSLGEAINQLNAWQTASLPSNYQLSLDGQAKEFKTTARFIAFTLILAVLLVFMVLASQFNSYGQPLIIMLTQPLALVGGLWALWLTNNSLNIYSMIGLVLLMGLVAKNGILLIDLANQLRQQGMPVTEALMTACPQRMRPVLMTSLTVVLAMLPAAIGHGAGADTNGPLAVTIIGGLLSSTLLTLVVIPACYALFNHKA